MHRNKFRSLLLKYDPIAEQEKVYKQQMLVFLDACADCFERSCTIGHFTASSWLVNNTRSKCLLLHHAKLDMWLQLGGHCDGDPDVLNVAIKEAQEESGLQNIVPLLTDIFDLDIHLFPTYKNIPAHYHFDVRFLLQAAGNDQIVANSEAKDLKWFDLDPQALPTAEPTVLRLLHKYLQRHDV